jgi:hypothetical protein
MCNLNITAAHAHAHVTNEVTKGYLPWLSNDGIRLDGPIPPLMPEELVNVEWPDLDAEI